MKKELKKLLRGVEIVSKNGDLETTVSSIHFDSRESVRNSLFVAIPGNSEDGGKFINDAIKNGAKVIVHETKKLEMHTDILYIRVKDSRSSLATISHNFYNNPSEKLRVVGVTGTNGKTTTATLLFRLFRKLGFKTALISTIENRINDKAYPTTHTTPDPIKIAEFMSIALKEGCTHVFMECSSHAIHQKRTLGINFTGCIFTNLTHDHLDYHKTIRSYANAKKELFDRLDKKAFALGNLDDKMCKHILSGTKAKKYFFGLKQKKANFLGEIKKQSLDGLTLSVNDNEIKTKLMGNFNAYNVLGIFATAKLLGIKEKKNISAIKEIDPPTGRLEFIKSKGIYGVVDYAHSPDALKNILSTLRELQNKNAKIITVLGCGGDRDKTKRNLMGKIACELSDIVYFTSDNPRRENPDDILKDITKNLKTKKYEKVLDRAKAIKLACKKASLGDIVLVAGKGHETYQIFKDKTIHFSDMEELRKNLTHK